MSSDPAGWPGLAALRDRVPADVRAALESGRLLGFVGGRSPLDQIDHALGFVAVVEQEGSGGPGSTLDLGSGGGLPGLVLAACWPECRVILLDASRRRTQFLRREAAGLVRPVPVEVVCGRAEDLARRPDLRGRFELVTARSFGPPAVTAECGSPFLVLGGRLVVSEPPGPVGQRWSEEGLARVGLEDLGPAAAGPLHYRILRKMGDIPDRYPRRSGVPAKRPLF